MAQDGAPVVVEEPAAEMEEGELFQQTQTPPTSAMRPRAYQQYLIDAALRGNVS